MIWLQIFSYRKSVSTVAPYIFFWQTTCFSCLWHAAHTYKISSPYLQFTIKPNMLRGCHITRYCQPEHKHELPDANMQRTKLSQWWKVSRVKCVMYRHVERTVIVPWFICTLKLQKNYCTTSKMVEVISQAASIMV